MLHNINLHTTMETWLRGNLIETQSAVRVAAKIGADEDQALTDMPGGTVLLQ